MASYTPNEDTISEEDDEEALSSEIHMLAVKVLRPTASASDRVDTLNGVGCLTHEQKDFLSEAELMLGFDHPNVVSGIRP